MQETCTDNPASALALAAWQETLRHFTEPGQLPGVDAVLTRAPEDWVPIYEQTYARLDKRRRKQGGMQSGVFYTPAPVARYLIRQTLGEALKAAHKQIQRQLDEGRPDAAQALLDEVMQWQVIDPACGTGVFLVEALQALHGFYQALGRGFPQLTVPYPISAICQRQLFGQDLDAVAVEITRIRLTQWIHQLDGQAVAGAGARGLFEERLRCCDTLQNGGRPKRAQWDFVVGNPPFVSEVRRQSGLFRALKQAEGSYYRAKMDLCDAFLAWGLDALKPGGQLAFVLPQYWMQRSSTQALRVQLLEAGRVLELWRFPEKTLFQHAPGYHGSLLIWQKAPASDENRAAHALPELLAGEATHWQALQSAALKPMRYWLDRQSGKLLLAEPETAGWLQRLAQAAGPLLQGDEIQQGLVMPQGRLRAKDWLKLPAETQARCSPEAGVFLLTEAERDALGLNVAETALLKPYFQPGGFRAWQGFAGAPPDYWLIYTDRTIRRHMEAEPEAYARLRAHLDRFQAINTSAFAPYGLHRARQPVWFEEPGRIFGARQVMTPAFALVSQPAYVNEAFYSIRSPRYAPDFLLALLNSRLAWFWFYQQKRKGRRLQIDKDVLSAFPAPPAGADAARVDALADLACQCRLAPDTMLPNLQDQLNEGVYRLYQLHAREVDTIEQAWSQWAMAGQAG